MIEWFNYIATFKILVFSLLIGAALPALFALGARLGAAGAGVTGPQPGHRNPALTALSWAVYTLVLAVVILGVLFIARDFIAHNTGWYILGAKPT